MSTHTPNSYSPRSLRKGSRIGDYTIERFIASGGFGSVYRGTATDSAAPVAIKVLHPELRTLGDPMIRFVREAEVLQRLDHPNVVQILDSGILGDGRAYLVMELLVGTDVEEYVERNGRVSLAAALKILEPVCDALSTAHAQGIVHRDIKASNVFIDSSADEQRIILLDFGIAKIVECGNTQLTSSRMALGTPTCMAPEQIRGGEVDARTDVYALGGLAFHMLAGRQPFEGNSRTVLHYMQLYGRRPSLCEAANLGPAIDAIIGRAMAADPDDRYDSAGDFLAALHDAAAERQARRVGRRRSRHEQRPALGVYVDVRVGADHDADDDQILDATDSILEEAQEHFEQHGFVPAFEGSSATLFARRFETHIKDKDELRQTRETILAAVELHRQLQQRPNKGLLVNICVHQAEALCSDDQFLGGELLRLDRWAPDSDVGGVCFTSETLPSLDIENVPVPGSDRLHKITAASSASDKDEARGRRMHQEMMARLGQQTASLVHDFRSPLSAVLCNLESVLENVSSGRPASDDDREALEDAVEAALQLKAMTRDVLRSSSMEAYSPERRLVCVPEAVARAVSLTKPQVQEKATVHVHHEGDSYFMGSVGRFTQVLTNLLVNAAQAIEGRGDIFVRTRVTEDGIVKIAVRDTGPGISAEVQSKIFEPYFTTKGIDEGTGLGLATVLETIEEHGGSVSVDSSPGLGACFTISLPAAPSPQRAAMQ